MSTAFWGIVSVGAGAILKAIVDVCAKRYEKAQKIKEARDDLEADLRTQAFLWKEHAYAVRVAAIQAGVRVEDLPSVPKED